jgi:ribosomal protein S18 acetylase RimI-like enzyme
MSDLGFKIEQIDVSMLDVIAAMHINPSSAKVAEIIREHNSSYKFYLDKVGMFFDIEPAGIIVARQDKQILGFIIVSKNDTTVKRLLFKRGYLFRWLLNMLLLRYGLTREMIRKLFLVLYANFISKKVTPPKKTYTIADSKIWSLIVMESARGKHIGSGLIQAACDYAFSQGAHTIGVTVIFQNDIAQKAYQKAGFQIVDHVFESVGPSYYMSKSLKSLKS